MTNTSKLISAFRYHSIFLINLVLWQVSFGQHDEYLPINVGYKIDSCVISKESNGETRLYASHVYNNFGKTIKTQIFGHKGALHRLELYQYDSTGNIIEEFTHDLPDETAFHFDPETDLGKEMLREKRWHNRKTLIRSVYNTKNNVVSRSVFSASYDTEKLTEEHNTFNGQYMYNDNGCLIMHIKIWPLRTSKKDETIVDTVFFECDAKGHHIQKTEKNYGRATRVTQYLYDEFGKVARVRFNYRENIRSTEDVYEYDSLHNLISRKSIEPSEKVFAEYQMEYEDTLITRYYYVNGNNYETEINYTYNSVNQVSQSHSKKLRGSAYRTSPNPSSLYLYRYKYDLNNRVEERKEYWKRFLFNRYEGKSIFYYDEKNRLSISKDYDEHDSLRYINLYFYDSVDTLVGKTELDSDSLFLASETYFHDSTGVKVAREIYDENGFVTLYQTYKYNEVGLEIGGVFYRDGYHEEKLQYKYNQDGSYDSIKVQLKKGNRVIDEYELIFKYY